MLPHVLDARKRVPPENRRVIPSRADGEGPRTNRAASPYKKAEIAVVRFPALVPSARFREALKSLLSSTLGERKQPVLQL